MKMVIQIVRSRPQFIPVVVGIGIATMFMSLSILFGSVEVAEAATRVRKET